MNKTVMMVCPLARTFKFREQLIYKLRELKYEVVLVSENGEELEPFLIAGCKFELVSIDRRGKSIFNDVQLIKAYWKVIKKTKPDIVLTYTTKCSVYGGMVCRLIKVPYIVNNAGLIEAKGALSLVLNALYRLGFAGASCMMYQNDGEQREVQRILGNKNHFRTIPGSGVDVNQYRYADFPDEKNGIFFNFVARVMKSKGIDEYLECAKQIREKYLNVHFRIYGSFDDDTYKPIVDEYEKKGYIEFCGQKKDMKPEILSASAAIHPSYYEGMTNVVLEHSAMGRPCIGSNVPGVCDGIDDGKTGYVFEVGNVDSLVEAVEKFINLSQKEKEKMGVLAREKMIKEFDREIVSNVYVEEIHKVIGDV